MSNSRDVSPTQYQYDITMWSSISGTRVTLSRRITSYINYSISDILITSYINEGLSLALLAFNQHLFNQHLFNQHLSNQHLSNQHLSNQHLSNQHFIVKKLMQLIAYEQKFISMI
ncbi:hypothetical protein RIR_jg18773.t1 [Rhizophagus irregularis DAOM 181602=DAOM 197198]|nr:hypothetical protein RIR_jg18773.t1 [Rhizophagus irregularis DAOM 181602=DAOM 197198]